MSPGTAIGQWFYYIIGYQILVSIIIGFLIGYIARKLLKLAEERYISVKKKWIFLILFYLLYFVYFRKLIDKEIFMTFAIVLAVSNVDGYCT